MKPKLGRKVYCVYRLIDNYKDRYDGKLKVTKMDDSWYTLEFC